MSTPRLTFTFAALVALALVFASPAMAEYPQIRESGVIGMSFGWGNAGADLAIVDKVDRSAGYAGSFRLGFVITQRFTGELEVTGWRTVRGNDELTFALIAPAVTFFPVADSGAFLRGGIGWGATTIQLNKGTATEQRLQDRSGLGVLVGGGYEFRISKQVSFGPQLQWVYIDANSDLTKNADFLTFMVDLNYHY